MDDFLRNWMKQEMKEPERPEMLPEGVGIYDHDSSEYPDRIRVSFKDGHTEIYERRIEQPEPMLLETIKIIRKWRTGYQYENPEKHIRRRRFRK